MALDRVLSVYSKARTVVNDELFLRDLNRTYFMVIYCILIENSKELRDHLYFVKIFSYRKTEFHCLCI